MSISLRITPKDGRKSGWLTCMRSLKTNEAATLLNISANTLRSWERRYGFPAPRRSQGQHRLYMHAEVAALREALHEGLSVTMAVARARQGLANDGSSLVGALTSYKSVRADAAIEQALSLRSLESAVEEVLLPALDEILEHYSVESAAWAFAAQWAADWLRRATLFAPPLERPTRILLGDASRDELDPDFLYIRAFELFCVRAGINVMSLSARGASGIGEAIEVQSPDLVVVAGRHLADVDVAQWTYQVRRTVGAMPVVVYRRGEHRMRIPTTGTVTLPSGAGHAQRRLLELVETEQAERTVPASPPSEAPTWSPASWRTAS